MMSISGIQSNINFSYEDVIKFLEGINSNIKDDIMVKIFIQNVDKTQSISIDEILKIVHSSQTITDTFEKLQLSIIEHFIGFKEFLTIKKRINYYNSEVISELPKEGCFEMFGRLLTKKPPAYYTEYRTIYSNHQTIMANFIFGMRRDYGYCKMIDRQSSSKMYLMPQSLSCKRQMSHKSNITPQTSVFRSATVSYNLVRPMISPKIYPLPSDESPYS